MNREQLEHAIRAACDVSGDHEMIIFGSQAILGQYPHTKTEVWLLVKSRKDYWMIRPTKMDFLPSVEIFRLNVFMGLLPKK